MEAARDSLLPEPVPSCLERIRLVTSRPGAELDAARTRSGYLAALSRLEERPVQLSEESRP